MRAELELINALENAFQRAGSELIFIHSDILRGFGVERPEPFSRKALLAGHFEAVRYVTNKSDLWFPTFNYDFTKTRVFDTVADPSQVGHLSEYVRKNVSAWRTPVPVFSVAGTGSVPALPAQAEIDPFGVGSVFDVLKQRDGLIFNYGCGLESLTFIHYCESLANTLPYRYRKRFRGRIVTAEEGEKAVSVTFHVRPMGQEMTYDWPRLTNDLVQRGLLTRFEDHGREFQIISARQLAEYWMLRLNDDPLFLLTAASRSWVEPMLLKLGRGFKLEDFEQAEVTNHG